jgi:microcystin degradation protein MlrC
MVGYVWADEPRATAAAVLTGEDLGVLERQAAALATAYWEARERFAFGGPAGSIEACLERARLPGPRPFILADSGDNPTGGGVGDRVDVLRALLQRPVGETILAGVADPEATDLAYACGVGSRFAAEVGGALDPSGGRAKVEGRVAFLLDAETRSERQAVIALDGLRLVLTGRRRPFHALFDFARLELDPRAADLVVVKSGYLSPEMESLAARKAMALSPGVVDQRVESLPRVRAAAAFPFDKTLDWRPDPRASVRARRRRDAGS